MERTKARLVNKLKYLMACLEEINRILGCRLRIQDTIDRKYSLRALEQELKPCARNGPPRRQVTRASPSWLMPFEKSRHLRDSYL
jgi:hypothetical protein